MGNHTDCLREEWYEQNPDIETNLTKILEEPRKKRANAPRGYEEGQGGMCYPNQKILCGLINLLAQYRVDANRTLREIQDLIYSLELDCGYEDPKVVSLGGISAMFDRLEKELGISVKETSKDRIAKQRKERMRKAKAAGKKQSYHLSGPVKKKLETQKRLTQANKELKRLEKERKRVQSTAVRNARKLDLQKNPTKYVESSENPNEVWYDNTTKVILPPPKEIIHNSDKLLIPRYMKGLQDFNSEEDLMELYKGIMDKKETFEKRTVAFLPTPRQYLFLAAPENVVLYGGAAGGGKSYAMTIDALRYTQYSDYKAVIIRKTTPELQQLVDDSRELYPLAVPGAKFNGSDNAWRFPSGAQIRFGFLDRPSDKFKYQGIQYTYVGFDELAQHPTDEGFSYLRSRNRTTNKNMKPYVRATANPGSPWVYDMFIKDREPNTPFIMPGTGVGKVAPVTMRFIPAKLADNPHLDTDGAYRAMLHTLNDVERRQLLDGDWLASDDAMFPEFKMNTHIIEPFTIPRHWNRVAGLDYGYRDPSAAVWFAVNPDDGSLVVYDEFLQAGLTGREVALAIQERELDELVTVDHPIDWSVFARTGHTGPTIAESMLSVPGFRLRRADKNREAGWVQIHEYLRPDPDTGAPKIQVFSSCANTIKQLLGARVHKTKPNDLNDTRNSDGHWDLLDALRYGVMSRPRAETMNNNLHKIKQRNRWDTINGYFGC